MGREVTGHRHVRPLRVHRIADEAQHYRPSKNPPEPVNRRDHPPLPSRLPRPTNTTVNHNELGCATPNGPLTGARPSADLILASVDIPRRPIASGADVCGLLAGARNPLRLAKHVLRRRAGRSDPARLAVVGREQTRTCRSGGRFYAGRNAEFAEDIADMDTGGLRADEQRLADLTVGSPLAE